MILVSAVVYMISCMLLQALSRYREFAADRGSAILTGRPSALISALMKIDGGDGAGSRSGTCAPPPASSPRSTSSRRRPSRSVASLFSTHPPLEARIAALQRLEAQLQGTA